MDNFLDRLREFFRNDDIVSALTGEPVEPPFFDPKRKRNTQISTAVGYVVLFALMVLLSTILPEPPVMERSPDLPNLIFVMQEGPGGGGGGGGELSEDPASVQKILGEDQAKVALSLEEPDDLVFNDPDKPEEPEEEPEKEEVEEVPDIIAPVVAQAPDEETEQGILEGQEQLEDSRGSGAGEGSGTGEGRGIGEGSGSGIGEGTGGGYGGGAYRMGSGVTPPIVVRQVQPSFTEEALARKVQGDVIVEVVILKDGTVRPVRVLRGLSSDLNQKALDAASQWKFVPAKLRGQPVDLIAEIVVTFNIL